MSSHSPEKQLQSWIRSHHLICNGTDFIFETVDQSLIDRFESCLTALGGQVLSVKDVGQWPMGPRRSFKILRAVARVPRPICNETVSYWANHGSNRTRYSEISQ
ncbi:CpeR family transcriptional regulator [Synechococcus sp. BSF8S]|nr:MULTISPECIES: CpeR family transcriptional regulator [unclassified Synechococcus]MBC1259718.1 CpeR family transcriptional regulator [Synechococcus sp. BSF8S]MBC1262859.1 CpeR family transcriptional regulator [Synechococcus sp. BSA11S]